MNFENIKPVKETSPKDHTIGMTIWQNTKNRKFEEAESAGGFRKPKVLQTRGDVK